MASSTTDPALAELRKRIDDIDEQLIALLKERIGVVHDVGKLKEKLAPGQCPIRAGREARQMQRIARAFEGCSFSPPAAISLWRILISASLAVEGNMAVSTLSTPENMACWWQAGSYFGHFTPIIRQTAHKRVLADLIEGKACIGVLPVPRLDEVTPWWPDIATLDGKRPIIFARLPFLADPAKNAVEPALAIGFVEIEPSESDISYYALTLDETVSMHRLQSSFADAGLDARWVGTFSAQPQRRQLLAEINGFVKSEDPAMQKIFGVLGSGLLQQVFLGACATSIMQTTSQKVSNHA